MEGGNAYVQHIFVWCIGAIYLFAFASLYFQVPGLYSRKGLLPAVRELKGDCFDSDDRCAMWAGNNECNNNRYWMKKNCMESCSVCKSGEELPLSVKLNKKTTLLWFAPFIGLDTSSGMEVICLLGMILSFGSLVSYSFQNRLVFAVLWILYFSVYQVGQTFLWFQWDILLLETGFITILVAQTRKSKIGDIGGHHTLAFWLVKWLLFRLMFQSGIVKLTSRCPTWWNLTALDWHYESQCIPCPLAWYAHQLPQWFQKLSVVATFVIEIPIPFLFFAPVRSFRIWAFFSQVLLQVLIISTGNYNFFNLLTLALCLSLVDDRFIFNYTPGCLRKYMNLQKPKKLPERNTWYGTVLFMIKTSVFAKMVYWTIKAFNIRISNDEVLSDIAFTKEVFFRNLPWMTQVSIYIGILSFVIEVLKYLYSILGVDESWGMFKRLIPVSARVIFTTIIGWHFAISMVPFTSLDSNVRDGLWPIVKMWHHKSDSYELVHSYGLFRSMTGVGGRPELIIEGSNDFHNGQWLEYNFLYKPGSVSDALPIVAPHQPRLDWQMWFAALGSYQHNPWLINLIDKLLKGEKAVLDLMGKNPFPDKPPIYIRSRLFTYHYTRLSKQTTGLMDGILRSRRIQSWWRRDSPKEYTPPLSVNDEGLKQYIKNMGFLEEDFKQEPANSNLFFLLRAVRRLFVFFDPTLFMLFIVLISFIVNIKL